jgi:hypothetical protein
MAVADNGEKEEQLEENDSVYDNLKFNFEQNVSGMGFFTAYKYAQMPDALEAKNKAHGSGKIDTDSNIYAESLYTNKTWINGAYDDEEVFEDEEEATSVIQVKEDCKMTYIPLVMGIGSRYYSLNSVIFNSLLKEDDWIKNRDGLNSLHHRVDQAHGLNKVLDAQSNSTNNIMNIEVDLVDGRAHFGVLQLVGIPVDEEPEEDSEEVQVLWKKPLIELDEDYGGSFHIEKNINLYTYSEEEEEEEDSWLPGCYGGFSDMNYPDAKAFKSARGIFDCTCIKVPAKAQFPR